MKVFIGFALIGLAIIGLILIFKKILSKSGSIKGLFFWLFASASIGYASPFINQIQQQVFGATNEVLATIVNIVFFLLGGFVSLLITAIWNGIFFGKWKVAQGE